MLVFLGGGYNNPWTRGEDAQDEGILRKTGLKHSFTIKKGRWLS